jgi:hypothetical protein
MTAIVTIFKEELKDKEAIASQLKSLANDFQEVGEAYTYSPKPGKLYEFLNIAKEFKIAYGTHFNTALTDPSSSLSEPPANL